MYLYQLTQHLHPTLFEPCPAFVWAVSSIILYSIDVELLVFNFTPSFFSLLSALISFLWLMLLLWKQLPIILYRIYKINRNLNQNHINYNIHLALSLLVISVTKLLTSISLAWIYKYCSFKLLFSSDIISSNNFS